MTNSKPEIIFTFPACMGGVSSFNYNIINHSRLIKSFYSKVILLKEVSDNRAMFLDHFDVDEVLTFEYSALENQFHLQKRLHTLLGSGGGAIVTDNGLTIEAASRFKNAKTIFYLVHDYYYVNQAVKLADLIDVAIAHSSFFSDAVFASNPNVFAGRTYYIPYGVQQVLHFPQKQSGPLNMVFLGRLEEEKGVMKLFEIQKKLLVEKIEVSWTIIGKGSLKKALLQQWAGSKIKFIEPATVTEVYRELSDKDIFIFPTLFEGTPVSILECLASGVVTITHDLPGGIRDVVKDGVGFRCNINNIDEFTERIIMLHSNRELLKRMQLNCYQLCNERYEILKNADNYFMLFSNFNTLARDKKSEAKKLTKLDAPAFPNKIVKLIRSVR